MILLYMNVNYYPKTKVQLQFSSLQSKVFIPTVSKIMQPTVMKYGKTHYFKSRENKYFTINEMFI